MTPDTADTLTHHQPWAWAWLPDPGPTLALHLYQGPPTFENNNHHTWDPHARFDKSVLCHNKKFIGEVKLFIENDYCLLISKLKKFCYNDQHVKSCSEDTFSCLSEMTRVIFVIQVPGTDTLILQFYLNTQKYEDTLSWNQISLSAGFPQFPCFMLSLSWEQF